jgi:DNA-binding CsgD family transcriptional regulator
VRALAGAGILAYDQADYDLAHERLTEAVVVAEDLGDRSGAAYALHFLGLLCYRRADYPAMRAALTESVSIYRQVGDAWGLATALCSLGFDVSDRPLAEARPLQEESVALYRSIGDAWGLGRALNCLGETARAEGDVDRARPLYEESIARYRELGDSNAFALVSHNLGYVAQAQGDLRRAADSFAVALGIHAAHGDRRGAAHCLAGLAGMIGLLGQPKTAARLFGAADDLFATTGAAMDPVDRAAYNHNVDAIRRQLGETVFNSVYDAGATLAFDRAVIEADEALANLRTAAAIPPLSEAAEPAVPASQEPHGLTARELEVLQLLADGRSDQEIGACLFISKRTVSSHVAAIIEKLGVANRTAAATLAVRRGLV